jgi:hypothetical protein
MAAFLFAPGALAQTQDSADAAAEVAQAAGVGNADLLQIIGRVINIFLGFLGVVLLGLLIYAGFLWMTAGGDATKVEKAKLYIRNAIIGLVIIASAWAIVFFIFRALTDAGFGGFGGAGGPGGGGGFGGFPTQSGSLGRGIIESHLPARNAVNVPRNTAIIVTFKQPIAVGSLIQDYNDNGTPNDRTDDTVTEGVNAGAVRIYPTGEGEGAALTSADVRVRFTDDRKTFIFRPVNLLGSAAANTTYTVSLEGGRNGVLLESGDVAFGGAFANGYTWSFEVGTVVDDTPPRVVSVVPMAGGQYARNIIVQLTFSEAIDPSSATGFVDGGTGFQNIRVHANGVNTPPIDGEMRISNQYRTVEFIPAEACGQNSCGRQVFCLPGSAPITGLAQAATLEGTGPAAQWVNTGYDGVVDVAGNSLDGNGNQATQGPGTDDFSWAFGTSPEVNLAPPVIEETVPSAIPGDPGQSNVDLFAPITVRFNTLLQLSTLNTDNMQIQAQEPAEWADTFWWGVDAEALTSANLPVESVEDPATKHQASVFHRVYASSTEYNPLVLSGVQDAYQNCFNPAVGPGCPAGAGGPNCCQGVRQEAACAF